MRQPYWKPQHEVFIRSMLKHEDPTKAYRTAYPKASAESARVGGHRLYHYPHIRQRLEPILEERRAEVHRLAREEGAKREARQRERRCEMRIALCKLVRGETKKQRVFIVNKKPVIIEDDPATGTILDALTLDLRLEAGYDNWPAIERRFARIMATLQPRGKWEQPVINSSENAVQVSDAADSFQAVLLQRPPIPPTGFNDFSFASLKGECITTYSPFRGIGGKEQKNVAFQIRQLPVMISPANAVPMRPARNIKIPRFTRPTTKTVWPAPRQSAKSLKITRISGSDNNCTL